MDIFANIKSLRHTNAHGEINFYKIEDGSIDTSRFAPFKDKTPAGDYIVGHSESGHHHLLGGDGVEVLEREHQGMKVLFAILANPTPLKQDAAAPHEQQIVEPGKYIIGASLDYDPFTQQARRVAD